MPTNDLIARQKAQRAAIARAKQQVLVTGRRYKAGEEPRFRVFVRGKSYEVDEHRLALLLEGRTPADMHLIPIEDEG